MFYLLLFFLLGGTSTLHSDSKYCADILDYEKKLSCLENIQEHNERLLDAQKQAKRYRRKRDKYRKKSRRKERRIKKKYDKAIKKMEKAESRKWGWRKRLAIKAAKRKLKKARKKHAEYLMYESRRKSASEKINEYEEIINQGWATEPDTSWGEDNLDTSSENTNGGTVK